MEVLCKFSVLWKSKFPFPEINAKLAMSSPKETSNLNRPKHISVLLVSAALLVSVFAASATPAEALDEFAYRKIQVAFLDIDGSPVSGASVYGYCRNLHLLWPRINDHQYSKPWQESYLGNTGQAGILSGQVTSGRWAFVACGLSAGNHVVAGWTDFEPLPRDGQIRIRPKVIRKWSFTIPDTGQSSDGLVRHQRLFIRPKHVPIFIPVSIPSQDVITFELPASASFELWGQGAGIARTPAFVLNWGQMDSNTSDGERKLPGQVAILNFQGRRGRASLSWSRPWDHSLTGTVPIIIPSRMLLSPGAYCLGYRWPFGSRIADFVARRYDLGGGDEKTLRFDRELKAGLSVQKESTKVLARLFVVDENAHSLRRILSSDDKPLPFDGFAVTETGHHKARQTSPGELLFEVVGADDADKGQWRIAVPLPSIYRQTFQAAEGKVIHSRHFRMNIPMVLEDVAANHLAQLDELEDRMRAVSGRRKRRHAETQMKVYVHRRGSSATHDGAYIRIGAKIFFRDLPAMAHDFIHELAHNFSLTHGGLQETIVEASRFTGPEILSGQASKWLFIDRMNGIKKKEGWYPNTGFYLYCYSQGGPPFLLFMAANEITIRTELGKQGFSKAETVAALAAIALQRDLSKISCTYGMCRSPERYAQALQAVQKIVKLNKE